MGDTLPVALPEGSAVHDTIFVFLLLSNGGDLQTLFVGAAGDGAAGGDLQEPERKAPAVYPFNAAAVCLSRLRAGAGLRDVSGVGV